MNPIFLVAAIGLAAPAQTIDLDHPGALEALKASNPETYRRVAGVIDASYAMSCHVPEFRSFIRTKYEAAAHLCGPIVKTSYPPQRRLMFQIGDTRYSKTVQFEVKDFAPGTPGQVVPVK